MIIDPFENTSNSVMAPASDCYAIQPDDLVELPKVTKAIYVGNGGDIMVRPVDGQADVTFVNAISGSIIDVRARAIRASGTTATDLVGLV